MKQIFIACFILSLLTGCQKATLEQTATRVRTVDFHVVQKQSMTRAALADACTVLDYFRETNGEVTALLTQNSESESFGTVSDEMPYGTHTLYFVGHKSEVTDFADGVASFDKVTDTFSYTTTIEVGEETESSRQIELLRNVAKLELIASDELPDNLNTVELTITGASTGLNVKTGLGATESTQTKTILVPKNNIGKTDCIFSAFVFLLEEESMITFTFTSKDVDGNIIVSHTFEDVEMQTNYISRITGKVFGDDFGFQINASTEWAGEIDYEF